MNPLEEIQLTAQTIYQRERALESEYYTALLQLTLAGLKRFKFKLPVAEELPHQGDWSSKNKDTITLVEDEQGVIQATWFVYDHSGATEGRRYKGPLFDMPPEVQARTFKLLYYKHMALMSEMLGRIRHEVSSASRAVETAREARQRDKNLEEPKPCTSTSSSTPTTPATSADKPTSRSRTTTAKSARSGAATPKSATPSPRRKAGQTSSASKLGASR
jgi:hypothetical protein